MCQGWVVKFADTSGQIRRFPHVAKTPNEDNND